MPVRKGYSLGSIPSCCRARYCGYGRFGSVWLARSVRGARRRSQGPPAAEAASHHIRALKVRYPTVPVTSFLNTSGLFQLARYRLDAAALSALLRALRACAEGSGTHAARPDAESSAGVDVSGLGCDGSPMPIVNPGAIALPALQKPEYS